MCFKLRCTVYHAARTSEANGKCDTLACTAKCGLLSNPPVTVVFIIPSLRYNLSIRMLLTGTGHVSACENALLTLKHKQVLLPLAPWLTPYSTLHPQPTPQSFFSDVVSSNAPAVMRNLGASMPAVRHWADDAVLRNRAGRALVDFEIGKEERRIPGRTRSLPLGEFLDVYDTKGEKNETDSRDCR